MSYGLLRRLSPGARSSVVRGRSKSRRVFDISDIAPGWSVVDDFGERVGIVAGIDCGWVVVSRGLFRGKLFVPRSAIGRVAEDLVTLNSALASIDLARWRQRPRSPRGLQ